MKRFKFFTDGDNDDWGEDLPDDWWPVEDDSSASWMWTSTNFIDRPYDVIAGSYYGIQSFLAHFPDRHIVHVLNITGPNGIIHDMNNEGDGWGFDITSDIIRVEWIRYLEN